MSMMTLKQCKALHNIVDDIFAEAADVQGWSWAKLADKAGLGVTTVYNLGNCQTIYPRAQTIFLLARAVGMELKVVQRANKGTKKFRVVG